MQQKNWVSRKVRSVMSSSARLRGLRSASIEPRHVDHLGFRVEDVESFKKDLKELVKRNPALAPKPGGTEGDIRLKLLAKCKHGQFQLADPDGVPIDVAAR
jgi:hypothetical protein